jgi:hypothetical protein
MQQALVVIENHDKEVLRVDELLQQSVNLAQHRMLGFAVLDGMGQGEDGAQLIAFPRSAGESRQSLQLQTFVELGLDQADLSAARGAGRFRRWRRQREQAAAAAPIAELQRNRQARIVADRLPLDTTAPGNDTVIVVDRTTERCTRMKAEVVAHPDLRA